MKKLTALLITLALVISLTACFGGNTDSIRGEIQSSTEQESSTPAQSDNNTETEEKFELGKSQNGKYENNFLKLGFNLPKDWTFYTDKQILELNNLTIDLVDENTAELLKDANIVYDMYASNSTGNSVNINMEKVDPVLLATLNLEQNLKAQFESLKTSFESMGYTNVQINYSKLKIDGKEFDGAILTADIQGIKFYTKMVNFKRGSYVATVTVASIGDDITNDLLNSFYLL